MTTKDLRDIAAYYGSPCDFEFDPDTSDERMVLFEDGLTGLVLAHIQKAENFKLHLRPINSLTDGEVRGCAAALNFPVIGAEEQYPVVRKDALIMCAGFWVNMPEQTIGFDSDDANLSGSLIAYLQFIGVYVPGCIDEKYVQLTEP